MTKYEVFRGLRERGVKGAVVDFSGGNDEGGVDNITFVMQDGTKKRFDGDVYASHRDSTFDGTRWVTLSAKVSADDALATALAAPVDDEYGSFAGEFHVSGTVLWDAEAETVKMTGQQSVDMWSDFERNL